MNWQREYVTSRAATRVNYSQVAQVVTDTVEPDDAAMPVRPPSTFHVSRLACRASLSAGEQGQMIFSEDEDDLIKRVRKRKITEEKKNL